MAQGPVFTEEAVLCIQRDSFPDSKTVFQTNNPNRFSHFPFKGQKRNFSGVSNLAESCHKSNWEANLVQIVFTQAINFTSPLPLPLKAVSCKLAFVLLLLGDCVCVHSNIFGKSYPHSAFWKLSVCCCTSPSEEKTSAVEPMRVRCRQGAVAALGKRLAKGPSRKSSDWVFRRRSTPSWESIFPMGPSNRNILIQETVPESIREPGEYFGVEAFLWLIPAAENRIDTYPASVWSGRLLYATV